MENENDFEESCAEKSDKQIYRIDLRKYFRYQQIIPKSDALRASFINDQEDERKIASASIMCDKLIANIQEKDPSYFKNDYMEVKTLSVDDYCSTAPFDPVGDDDTVDNMDDVIVADFAAEDIVEELSSSSTPGQAGDNSSMGSACRQKNPLQCPVCRMIFAYKKSYRKHIKRLHKTDAYLKCDICKKVFSTPGNLRKHSVRIHKVVYLK